MCSVDLSAVEIKGCELVVGGKCARCRSDYFPNGNGGCKRVIIGCQ